MTNKLTLAQTWKLCLQMWKWIVKEIEKGTDLSVESLKQEWIDEHGYKAIENDCFFCDYGGSNMGYEGDASGCTNCPGRAVSKRFSCCAKSYHYYHKPKKFYQKLLELDAERKKK